MTKIVVKNTYGYKAYKAQREFWDLRNVPPRPELEPFYVESRGEDMVMNIQKYSNNAPSIRIEYSLDGATWRYLGYTYTAISINIPAGSKMWLRANTNAWATETGSSYNYITTTKACNVGGNIMSLLYGSNFTGNETTFPSSVAHLLHGIFRAGLSGTGNIVDASKLLLPATTLTDGCYSNMFANCTSLIAAPALPAETLAPSCYEGMFLGCSSLTTAPALPAETLANYCYSGMFSGCASLTTAPTILPATTLAEGCYKFMFRYCTSLTTAPELPAGTLVRYSYSNMFQGCSSLNYIKALFTTLRQSGQQYTDRWVDGVAATGTFVKRGSWNVTGNNGVPTGWTVVEV